MILYLILGLTYGFGAAIMPGPFQTYLIAQTLSAGWKRTLPKTFAPLISDVPVACLVLLVLSQMPHWIERFLHLGGGLFVLFLAYGAFRAWRAGSTGEEQVRPGQDSMWKAVLVNVLNPNAYLGWSLVTGPLLLRGWRESPAYGIILLVALYSTMILLTVGIIVLFSLARNLGPRVDRYLLGVSALALFCFGLYQLYLGMIAP